MSKQHKKKRHQHRIEKSLAVQPVKAKLPETVHAHWSMADLSKITMQFSWTTPPFRVEQQGLPCYIEPLPCYDSSLLEKARTQWQFGDWKSLVQIDVEAINNHPDRAKLALLAAAGHLQVGDQHIARQYLRLAQEWGCSKKLISQILVAGVYNSLGRASAINGNRERAAQHFEKALAVGSPASAVQLLSQARLGEQLMQLGLTNAPR
jgi:tetratricopeptide (TPR) repeat protein